PPSGQTRLTPARAPYGSCSPLLWCSAATSAPTLPALPARRASDLATTTLTLTNDSTAPSGSITAPAASANVRGSAVTVSSNSSDSRPGVATAPCQRSPAGAGTWTTLATDTTSPSSVS